PLGKLEVLEPNPGARGRRRRRLSAHAASSILLEGVLRDQEEMEEYDENEIDEVECPKCHGRGTYGLVGNFCKLRGGDCVVTKERRPAYINKHGLDDGGSNCGPPDRA